MKVYAAINAIQKELNKTGITKGHKNAQQGYQFRGIDDVYNALSPLLAEHGLCILPRVLTRTMVERKSNSGGALFSVCVEAEFDFVCSEDGSKHTVKTFGEAMDSGDKATNKALSAAYKYACIQAFAIPTEGENDADAVTHEVAAKTEARTEAAASRPTGQAAAQMSHEGIEVAQFIPEDVSFVDGKGKGAGKTFSEIYNSDGDMFSGTEKQGLIAEQAIKEGREIVVSFKRNGKFRNTTNVTLAAGIGQRAVGAGDIEEAPF